MKVSTLLIPFLWIACSGQVSGQGQVNVSDSVHKPKIEYAEETFRATNIVIGQSIENTPKGYAQFFIAHHFGRINSGYQNIYGLNQAFIRIGGQYGLFSWLDLGAGFNSALITWDGNAKVKFLRQSMGGRRMPLSLSGYVSMAAATKAFSDKTRENYTSSRLTYAFELLIARKFNDWLSLQLTPAMVHRNLVATTVDHNDVFALGGGGRARVSEKVSINIEGYYLFPNQVDQTGTRPDVHSSLSVGVDIQTAGHVFQIFLTNSEGLIEEYFIPATLGDWMKGDIYLGFNIHRLFSIAD